VNVEHETNWTAEECANVKLGNTRLDARVITRCDRFSDAPESPLNQACADWADTKAASRFFQHAHVEVGEILAAHRCQPAQRAQPHTTLLAIQDTRDFVYTSHPKTTGLGTISLKKDKPVEQIYSHGLVVHTCLAVTTDGLPLGLLDQNIFSRTLRAKQSGRGQAATPHGHRPVEAKERDGWREAVNNTTEVMGATDLVTVCDREADRYDFFTLSHRIGAPVRVRANAERTINRHSRDAEQGIVKLWEHMREQPETGSSTTDIPKRSHTPPGTGGTHRHGDRQVRIVPPQSSPQSPHAPHGTPS
jgi:hypothetical protein